jgi:hypothetical protein
VTGRVTVFPKSSKYRGSVIHSVMTREYSNAYGRGTTNDSVCLAQHTLGVNSLGYLPQHLADPAVRIGFAGHSSNLNVPLQCRMSAHGVESGCSRSATWRSQLPKVSIASSPHESNAVRANSILGVLHHEYFFGPACA